MNTSFLRAATVMALSTTLAVSIIETASARGKGDLPHGFRQGEKIGWRANFVPPGWGHGRKVGWRGGAVPPGLRF
jgi:hypothetical protein